MRNGSNIEPGNRRRAGLRYAAALLVVLWSPWLVGDEVEVRITGLDAGIEPHVRAVISIARYQGVDSLSAFRIRKLARQAAEELSAGLRSFGYFNADTVTDLRQTGDQKWQLELNVNVGPPMTVSEADIRITGPGQHDPVLQQWLRDWPLPSGVRLDQRRYTEAKQALLNLLPERGFFDAHLSRHRLLVDTTDNRARIELHLQSGPQAVFGEVRFHQQVIAEALLPRYLPFQPGDGYRVAAIDDLRENLSLSGYWARIDIEETRDSDSHPTTVDLNVRLEPRKPNLYQTSIGLGSDTGVRAQFGWKRYLLSPRGDSLNFGFGIQQQDKEFEFLTEYQRPWGVESGRFLFAQALLRRQTDSFNFNRALEREPVFPGFDGARLLGEFRAGTIHRRELPWLPQPISEHLFVSVLSEDFSTDPVLEDDTVRQRLLAANRGLASALDDDIQSVAVGASWDWIHVQGTGFDVRGTHIASQLLLASDRLASDISFQQIYLDGRSSWRLADRWKLIVRSEIGYTNAPVNRFNVQLDGRKLDLSITRLPEQYRFKAGGDRSVRGYGFEQLSDNRNGSNHLFTASTELEFRIGNSWSAALFFDAGNAFNDFSDADLKRGVGLGARWYTAVGPIRLDLAKALDEPGKPLRLHFTLGSPLL